MKYKIPSLFILLFLLASCSPATDPNKDTFDCYYETYNITVNLKNNDNYQKLLGLANKSKHISDNDELSQFNKSVQSFFQITHIILFYIEKIYLPIQALLYWLMNIKIPVILIKKYQVLFINLID